MLRQNLKDRKISNVEVLEGDFREIPLPNESYKVFANPPFSLSAETFYKLLDLKNVDGKIIESVHDSRQRPEAIYLILQKQFALKLIITERHYTSQLGKILSKYYVTKIRLPLRPTDFTPPPKVPTVLFEAKVISSDLHQGSVQRNCNPS